MKKVFFVLFLQCAVFLSVFAESKIKIKKNQVAIIAKVHVETKTDTDFIFKALELPEEAYARNSNYFMPCLFPKDGKTYSAEYIDEFEEQAEAEDGEYCIAIYDLGADRTLRFDSPVHYLYHKDYLLYIYLPTGFKVQIPEGESCVYIGDLNYTVEGEFFKVTALKIKDSYEEASAFVNSKKGLEEVKLCRGELNPLTKEDVEHSGKKTKINLSKGGKRFKMKNRLYSYR